MDANALGSAFGSLSGLAPGSASSPAPAKLSPQLVSAAHEFEASLMQELLKPLQGDALFGEDGKDDAGDLGGGSPDSEGGSDNAVLGYGLEMLAKAISEHGGFGIAKQILHHFEGKAGAQQKAAEPAATGKAGALTNSYLPNY